MVQLEIQQNLAQLLKQEVSRYVANSPTSKFHLVTDDLNQRYTVIIVPQDKEERPSWVFVFAYIIDDYIVIDEDGAIDKPLHQALMVNAHIPREQIILAYQGEKLPIN